MSQIPIHELIDGSQLSSLAFEDDEDIALDPIVLDFSDAEAEPTFEENPDNFLEYQVKKYKKTLYNYLEYFTSELLHTHINVDNMPLAVDIYEDVIIKSNNTLFDKWHEKTDYWLDNELTFELTRRFPNANDIVQKKELIRSYHNMINEFVNNNFDQYFRKYLKYKKKYINLKNKSSF